MEEAADENKQSQLSVQTDPTGKQSAASEPLNTAQIRAGGKWVVLLESAEEAVKKANAALKSAQAGDNREEIVKAEQVLLNAESEQDNIGKAVIRMKNSKNVLQAQQRALVAAEAAPDSQGVAKVHQQLSEAQAEYVGAMEALGLEEPTLADDIQAVEKAREMLLAAHASGNAAKIKKRYNALAKSVQQTTIAVKAANASAMHHGDTAILAATAAAAAIAAHSEQQASEDQAQGDLEIAIGAGDWFSVVEPESVTKLRQAVAEEEARTQLSLERQDAAAAAYAQAKSSAVGASGDMVIAATEVLMKAKQNMKYFQKNGKATSVELDAEVDWECEVAVDVRAPSPAHGRGEAWRGVLAGELTVEASHTKDRSMESVQARAASTINSPASTPRHASPRPCAGLGARTSTATSHSQSTSASSSTDVGFPFF